MLTIMGYLMIAVFMAALLSKKVAPFAGLILIPVIFGIMVCILTGNPILETFEWIKGGMFYTVDAATGKITSGIMGTAVVLLFAILYFSIMLEVGLFEPMCVSLIRLVKGDPLKIALATALISFIVSLDGDGTTTVLIVTAATLLLYDKMKMKRMYLALLIVIPNSIMNFVPWSGPLARALPVLNLEPGQLFLPLIPGMVAATLYTFGIAYVMGKKERVRLGYTTTAGGIITNEDIERIVFEVQESGKEFKQPKMFWFNLILTIAVMIILIGGYINGGVTFVIATAIALIANYPDINEQGKRLIANGGEAMGPVGLVFGAGCIMGVLNGSGMADAIAMHIVSLIPESLGSHIPFIFALISGPGLVFLPNDAFYFGILPVVAPISFEYGATAVQIGVASMIGQSLRFGSPLVAFLYVLVDRCGVNFGDYQKEFFKWVWPIFFIHLFMAVITGALPL